MARAKARIVVTRIAHPRQRSRRGWKLVDLTGAVAVLLILWWVLDGPSTEQRRGLAEWAGRLGTHIAPSQEPQTARLRARAAPREQTENLDASRKPRGSPADPRTGAERAEASASPERNDDLNAGLEAPAPILERAYQIRDSAEFGRAEVALRLALQDRPDGAAELAAEETAEGLRIRLPTGLFAGSGEGQRLIAAVAAVAAPLANRISICAGADKAQGAPDWDLSFARAAEARRILEAEGVAPARFDEISVRGGDGLAVTILRDAAAP